jgi:hypothetical protein
MEKIQKCPRCGEDIIGGYCFSCGYELPEEPVMQQAVPHGGKPQQSAETDSYVPPVYPEVHVANDNAYRNNTANDYSYRNNNAADDNAYRYNNTANNNAYGNNGANNNSYGYNPGGGASSGFMRFTETYSHMSFGEKFKHYWWYILLACLVPGLWLMPGVVGVATGLSHGDRPSKIFAGEQILLAIVGLIIFG